LKHALDLILSIPWLSFEKQGCIFLVEEDPDSLVMKAESGLCDPIKLLCSAALFQNACAGALLRHRRYSSPIVWMGAMRSAMMG
jgi:hypothetical protein